MVHITKHLTGLFLAGSFLFNAAAATTQPGHPGASPAGGAVRRSTNTLYNNKNIHLTPRLLTLLDAATAELERRSQVLDRRIGARSASQGSYLSSGFLSSASGLDDDDDTKVPPLMGDAHSIPRQRASPLHPLNMARLTMTPTPKDSSSGNQEKGPQMVPPPTQKKTSPTAGGIHKRSTTLFRRGEGDGLTPRARGQPKSRRALDFE